jgi:hypothetical protein
MGLSGPSFSKVWNQGAPAPGTLVGIRRSRTNSGEESDAPIEVVDFAVDLGGEVIGVRQDLSRRDELRLGMPVTVHRDGKAAVIRWGGPSGTRWERVTPPTAGIEDRIDGPPNGWVRGEAEILELGVRSAKLGLTSVSQAKVRFHGGVDAEALVDKYVAPFYASHLGAVGTRVAAQQHPRDARRIVIDWPAAAVADPGVGVAPLTVSAPAGHTQPGFGRKGFLDRLQDQLQATTAGVMGAASGPTPPTDDPVPWETYLAAAVAIKNEPGTPPDEVAQRHGIPAGEWDAAHKRWMARVMKDWQLGAAYGQAMS